MLAAVTVIESFTRAFKGVKSEAQGGFVTCPRTLNEVVGEITPGLPFHCANLPQRLVSWASPGTQPRRCFPEQGPFSRGRQGNQVSCWNPGSHTQRPLRLRCSIKGTLEGSPSLGLGPEARCRVRAHGAGRPQRQVLMCYEHQCPGQGLSWWESPSSWTPERLGVRVSVRAHAQVAVLTPSRGAYGK